VSGCSSFVIVTPPTVEPLTLEEAKTFARLDGTNAEPAPAAIPTVALAPPRRPATWTTVRTATSRPS
jgi:hypothetical protein